MVYHLEWHSFTTETGYPFDAAAVSGDVCLVSWAHGKETVRMTLSDILENPDLALGMAADKVR